LGRRSSLACRHDHLALDSVPTRRSSDLVEATVLDPENPHILGPHLCAAAQELPVTREDAHLFGPSMEETLDSLVSRKLLRKRPRDRKSTRLNSSHVSISYAAFCLRNKNA